MTAIDRTKAANVLAKAKRRGHCLLMPQNGRVPQVRVNYVPYQATWLAYWLWVDEAIDPGTPVYRLCGETQCIEPMHLSLSPRRMRGNEVLTEDDVRMIRRCHREGARMNVIANELGVAPTTVSNAARGTSWAWVDEPASVSRRAPYEPWNEEAGE